MYSDEIAMFEELASIWKHLLTIAFNQALTKERLRSTRSSLSPR